jgi:hypothetical protein
MRGKAGVALLWSLRLVPGRILPGGRVFQTVPAASFTVPIGPGLAGRLSAVSAMRPWGREPEHGHQLSSGPCLGAHVSCNPIPLPRCWPSFTRFNFPSVCLLPSFTQHKNSETPGEVFESRTRVTGAGLKTLQSSAECTQTLLCSHSTCLDYICHIHGYTSTTAPEPGVPVFKARMTA